MKSEYYRSDWRSNHEPKSRVKESQKAKRIPLLSSIHPYGVIPKASQFRLSLPRRTCRAGAMPTAVCRPPWRGLDCATKRHARRASGQNLQATNRAKPTTAKVLSCSDNKQCPLYASKTHTYVIMTCLALLCRISSRSHSSRAACRISGQRCRYDIGHIVNERNNLLHRTERIEMHTPPH